jgi:hypothetical protein
MERRPEQHGGVSVRQDKTIAIWPDWILRIETENPVPDGINQGCESHGSSGMSGLGLLHGVNRKRADAVNAQLIEFSGA